ncbi:hypothetical protein [Xylophilus ampelinus]|uniref:Uncharacterized protein n=1 Tax=Xylophilus ampelinus TaxID=54067 RepID=A0A318SJ87_9BURK|nr:hypothetical protein [Xylophilus ampelinus]MCS4511155.1 hypothetical protein [Xylophilus ampelinus]PYE75092.1 hypothetical protein DFQ15_12045 [Xylophilus ampelinus]
MPSTTLSPSNVGFSPEETALEAPFLETECPAHSSTLPGRNGTSELTEALQRQPSQEASSSSAASSAIQRPRTGSLRELFLKGLKEAEKDRLNQQLAMADGLPTKQLRREARTEANLTGMLRLGMLEAQLQKIQTAEYRAQLRQIVNTDRFRQPEALKGAVARGDDGLLHSPDKAIDAVLQFVQIKPAYREAAAQLTLPPDAELRLPLEADILLNAWEFAAGCKVRELHLGGDGSEPEEADIDLSTYAAREAIKKGAKAFGADASFRPITIEDVTGESDVDQETRALVEGLGPNPQNAPFSFLQGVRYRADSNDEKLKALVGQALSDHDPATLELRGRMGAQAVNAVLTQKHLTPELGWAIAASLIGSGGVAFALDVLAWSAVRAAVAKTYGEDHPITNMTEVVLASLTAAVAETADSCVIKRLLGHFRGEALMPKSLAEVLNDLKESAISGGIAAIGAIPNNAAALTQRWASPQLWAMQPVSAVTNQIAVSTSGAMVPREVAAGHEEMAAGALERMNEGFFPAPQLTLQEDASDAQLHRALAEHVKEDTRAALEVAPGHGLAINSMGIGSVISLVTGFLPFDTLARAKVVPEVAQKIVTIMVNTPTEVLSLGAGLLGGQYFGGIGGKFTTDEEKNRLIVELIAKKAVERWSQAEGGTAPSVEITEKELRAIEHPSLALTFPAGRAIVNTLNGVTDLLARTWGAIRGTPSQELAEQVNVDTLLSQMPVNRPA